MSLPRRLMIQGVTFADGPSGEAPASRRRVQSAVWDLLVAVNRHRELSARRQEPVGGNETVLMPGRDPWLEEQGEKGGNQQEREEWTEDTGGGGQEKRDPSRPARRSDQDP